MLQKRTHIIQTFFIQRLLSLAGSLSWEFAYKIGHGVGLVLYYSGVRKKIAMVNLDIVYGNTKTVKEKKSIYKKSLINLGHVDINYLRLPYLDSRFWAENCKITNEKELKRLVSRKTGIVFVVGHLGMWDLGIGKLGHSGFNISVIGKKIKNPVINELVLDTRRRLKTGILRNKNIMDAVLEILNAKNIVVMAIDQNLRRSKGIYLDWMGRPASSIKSASYVVKKTGASVLSGYMVQNGPKDFEVMIGDEITWEEYPEDPEKELVINSQKQADVVQKIILEKPELWFWLHKRWKFHPDKTLDPYL